MENEKLLEEISIDDLLIVANQISDDTGIFIPPSVKETKEGLIEWISKK
ncbi:hypothetical protein BSPWISOXPB_4253 [uncultured Gammaproteobacteria bacterium]|nr:hypothetical protein BSPWISOXPB_4253 [uncultured Gammaproteobacteria bacterium]